MPKKSSLKLEIIFSGFGGQGILFAGNFFALAGILAGYQATFLPVYGPEMRGGTCNCTTIISTSEIASPVVKEPNVLVLLNLPSYQKFIPHLQRGGVAFLNSDLIPEDRIQEDQNLYLRRKFVALPMTSLAEKIGYPLLANMVAVGALLAFFKPFPPKILELALRRMLKGDKEKFLEVNRKALAEGIRYIESQGLPNP